MPIRLLPVAAVAVLAACANEPAVSADATVNVYRSAGSKQCEGGGTPLATAQQQLADAGVKVLSASCGTDGRMRPQMCGRPDGAILIFEVAGRQAADAQKLGYEPLTKLPDAEKAACR